MSLEQALAYLNANIKDCAVRPLSAFPNMRVEPISSRSLIINSIIGRGGWPRGHMVELFGGEGVGKTTICCHAIAEAQSRGLLAGMIDAEHRFDLSYATSLGVDPSQLLFYQPPSGVAGMEAASLMLRSNQLGLLIIDSIDAVRPLAEEEADFGKANVGRHAALINQVCRDFTPIKGECCIIFTNQLRENPGKMFGNPEYTPGGRAMKFYASVRLELRKGETQLNDDELAVSNIVKVKAVKNSVAPPFKTGEIKLVYGKGVDMVHDTLEAALLAGLIIRKGSYYKLIVDGKETNIGQGEDATFRWLKENGRLDKLRSFIIKSEWYQSSTGKVESSKSAAKAKERIVSPASEEGESSDADDSLSSLSI
jgi:recombination protein RecA